MSVYKIVLCKIISYVLVWSYTNRRKDKMNKKKIKVVVVVAVAEQGNVWKV